VRDFAEYLAPLRYTPAAPDTIDVPREPWMADAACAGMDASLFFPVNGNDVAAAVEICQGCPVRDDCLDYALERGEDHGVWGGCSERERRRIRRSRRRWGAA
jgi:WhiB family transcriptional regulator, redox-sensing transcriptional regulator